MNRQVDKPSRWNDIFGWFSFAFFAVSLVILISVLQQSSGTPDQIFGFGAVGVMGFASGLIGTIKGALQHRTAIISVLGMLASAVPAGIVFLLYVLART